MRAIQTGILAALAVVAAFGQEAKPKLEFEVASIKPSGEITVGAQTQVKIGVHIDGAQIHCSYLSLKDYLRMAYRVKDHQIVAPDWVGSQRFEISAKLPEGATRDQVPEMLQNLLVQRFQIQMHHDKKEFPVYGLVAAKGGVKLKESPLDPEGTPGEATKAPISVDAAGGRAGVNINYGRGAYMSFANNKLEIRKLTMTALADTLARFVDRPVVDMTELQGTYDLTLEITAEDYRAMLVRSALNAGVALPPEALRALEGSSDESLFAALQGFGLKMEPRKAPLDVLVIDQVSKTPIEN